MSVIVWSWRAHVRSSLRTRQCCGSGATPRAIRASASTPAHIPSGAAAEGEAPGCLRATRTRRTPGRMRKFSGGSSTSASPSMPAGTGRSASTANVGADHSRHGRCSRWPPFPASGGRPDDGHPEQAVVDARAGARADRSAESVAVVGDEHRRTANRARARPVRSSAGRGPRGPGRARPARCRAASAASRRDSRRAGPLRHRDRARRC